MEFRVLGPLEVEVEGRQVVLGGHKQRIVLAMLLLHANEVVSTDALIEAVWGEEPPKRARSTLQVYIANLRRLLDPEGSNGRPPRLIRKTPGYRLSTAHHEVDLDRFRGLIEEGHVAMTRHDPMRASLLLRAALELWRGPPFPDLADCAVPMPEISALEEARRNVLEDRLVADLEAGRADQVVTELAVLVKAFPLRERLHELRIVALYRMRRQPEALAAYETARSLICEELGLDPSPELQELHCAVLRQDPSLDLPTLPGPFRPALPVAPNPLIGREDELKLLTALVNDESTRLVTLLGPGGTGKSRLGLGVATAVQPDFPDGVYFVALAPLTDPGLVLAAVASALGVRETARSPLPLLLADQLRDQRALLVLDNFEQLLPAASQVSALLSATQHLKILVTSRAPLRISGEHEYPILPLALPPLDPLPPLGILRDIPSVRLYVERARAVSPAYELRDGEDAAAVAAICNRLDGLPLAIELAAARGRVLSPPEILRRLTARLRLLTGGPHDVPTRQQTLRGTIEWSYDLLGPQERVLFASLAAFRGGCTLDAVESVCTPEGGDPLDLLDQLDSLVSQSLLQRRSTPTPSECVRLVMLQTIHEFAEELLDGSPGGSVLRRRHSVYYAEMAEAAEPPLKGGKQLHWLTQLHVETDNMRAALAWSCGPHGDADVALRLVAALWHFWEMSGLTREGRQWVEAALAHADAASPERRLGALSGAATLAWSEGEIDQAARMHREALELARRIGDRGVEAFTLNALAAQLIDRFKYEEAEAMCEQAGALAIEIGDQRTAGMARHNSAEIAFHRGQFVQAAERYEDALRLFADLDDQWLRAVSLQGRGLTALRLGDTARAGEALRDSLRLISEVGENYFVAECLEGLASVAATSRHPMRAARLLGAADRLRRRIGAPRQLACQADLESLLDVLHMQLGEDSFAQEWEAGQDLTVQQCIEEGSRA